MKKLLLIGFALMVFASCKKDDPQPQNPRPDQKEITDAEIKQIFRSKLKH